MIVVFFFTANKKLKTILNCLGLVFFFCNTHSRILGLIWRRTAYFVQKVQIDTTIILHSDIDRRASCRARATHSWRQIKSLQTQNVSYFTLYNLTWLWSRVILFREYLMLSPVRKAARDQLTRIWRQDGSFSRLQRPDWLMQVPGASTLCKDCSSYVLYINPWLLDGA